MYYNTYRYLAIIHFSYQGIQRAEELRNDVYSLKAVIDIAQLCLTYLYNPTHQNGYIKVPRGFCVRKEETGNGMKFLKDYRNGIVPYSVLIRVLI